MSTRIEFEHLFRTYYEPLCNYARAILKDELASEDVVQGVFESLWLKGISDITQPKRYLLRAVKFGCIDALRKRRKSLPLSDSEPYLDNLVDEAENAEIDDEVIQKLTFLVAQLPEKTRAVFLLSRHNGYTYREISEELQISIKTVENQMSRALRHLRSGFASLSK